MCKGLANIQYCGHDHQVKFLILEALMIILGYFTVHVNGVVQTDVTVLL